MTALLTPGDLGPEWYVATPAREDHQPGPLDFCGDQQSLQKYPGALGTEVGLVRNATVLSERPALIEDIILQPPGTAVDRMDELLRRQNCVHSESADFTNDLIVLAFPALGDQSAAYRLTETTISSGRRSVAFVVFVRLGNYLLILLATPVDVPGLSEQEMKDIAGTALVKVSRLPP